MPCRDSGDDYADSLIAQQRLNAATAAACDALGVLERGGEIGHVSGVTERWWAAHKLADAQRRARESQELERLRLRAEAIKKLTPTEKALLGIRD